MAADTGMNESKMGPNQKLRALGKLRAHNRNIGDLIQKGRRSPDETRLLFGAMAAFKDGKLAGVVRKQKKLTPAYLNQVCDLPIEQARLQASDLRYLQKRGIRYVGEVFYIFIDPRSGKGVQLGTRILKALEDQFGLPSGIDPITLGWQPCYWDDAHMKAINALILELCPTCPVTDWDLFAENTYRGNNNLMVARWERSLELRRDPARLYHTIDVHFAGQIVRTASLNSNAPTNKQSPNDLLRIQKSLKEVGSMLWAGIQIPSAHIYPAWEGTLWDQEFATMRKEEPLFQAARNRLRAKHAAIRAEREREEEERLARKAATAIPDAECSMHGPWYNRELPSIAILLKRIDEVWSTDDYTISVRTMNCLENAGIETMGELVGKTEPQLLKVKNFGRKALNQIKELLAELGLFLGMELTHFKECFHDHKTAR
jgi:hypothetical protein